MFSDVAQEIEEADGCSPAGIVEQPRGILFCVEVEQLGQLHFHAGDVVIENLLGEQLTFGGLTAWIADAAGRAACERDGIVTEQLKAAQSEQRHEIADVQRIRCGIKSAVKSGRRGEFLRQLGSVSAIGDESPPVEFFQNAHGRTG